MGTGQPGWRWCSRCQGMFFSGNNTSGRCPANTAGHDPSGSGGYSIDLEQSDASGQHNWRWCRKCQGLFFNGHASGGRCPTGQAHDPGASGDYILHDSSSGLSGQNQWRWCRKCEGMFFAGGGTTGVCPAGSSHDGRDSGDYLLQFEGQGPGINPDPVLAAIRVHAGILVRSYVPCDTGDAKFAHIAKDYKGGGTTCGFLCHWLMWRLGCNDAKIVNRAEPGFKYVDGQNISRIFNLGREPFVKVIGTSLMQQGLEPELGDIVFIKQHPDGPQDTEHVFVFLEKTSRNGTTLWQTGEAGQTNTKGQQCARLKERQLKLGSQRDAKVTGNNPQRNVFGWISLAKLGYNALPPVPPMPFDPLLIGGFGGGR
jgi:hypothetical protein